MSILVNLFSMSLNSSIKIYYSLGYILRLKLILFNISIKQLSKFNLSILFSSSFGGSG